MSLPVPGRRAVAVPFSSIRGERLSYLEPGRIPLGLVTVIGGYAGLGKSQFTCLLAARLSRGEYGEPAAAVIATAEDSPTTTVQPRLRAVQADLELVHLITIQSDDGLTDGIEIPNDLDTVAGEMRRLGARLLIIDPLVAHLPTEIDSYKDQSVRRALAPLYRLAQELSCAVVVCIHLNKAQGMQPLQRLSGSGAFGAAARSVLLLDRDPDDPDGEQGRRRVLAHVKSNDGPEMPSLLYEIEPIVLPATAEEPELDTSRLALLGESPHSGRALLASAAASEEERFAKDEAQDFLLTELGDYQRHQAGELFKGARKLGINEKALQRARKAIGAQTEKVGFGSTGAWEWWLPAKATSETSKPAFLRKGDTPREVSPYVESSDLTASGDGAAVAPTPSGPLTFEARELLKQERDRLTREQLEAKDAATAEECRRLQAEAEKVDDADLDYYRSRRDAPLENPLPGDKAFLDYVAGVHAAGAITTGEALEREQHHALILRARKA